MFFTSQLSSQVCTTPVILSFAVYLITWGIKKKKKALMPRSHPGPIISKSPWVELSYPYWSLCSAKLCPCFLLCLPRWPSRIEFQVFNMVNLLVMHPLWGSAFLCVTPPFAFWDFLGLLPAKFLILNPGLRESEKAEVWKVSVCHLEHRSQDIWCPAFHRPCGMMEETGIQITIT